MRIDITKEFDTAATKYDWLVPGSHYSNLSRSVRRMQLPGQGAGLHLLDLGCGTGASTLALLAAAPKSRITAVDASAGMLAKARRANWPQRVTFVHAQAEELTAAGVHGPFDGIFAAYLVRNLPDPDPVLAKLYDQQLIGCVGMVWVTPRSRQCRAGNAGSCTPSWQGDQRDEDLSRCRSGQLNTPTHTPN